VHKYALCIFCLTTALDFAWGVLRGARLTFIVGGTLDHAARGAGMGRRCELRGARAWGRDARITVEVKRGTSTVHGARFRVRLRPTAGHGARLAVRGAHAISLMPGANVLQRTARGARYVWRGGAGGEAPHVALF
jgi:hypothetical protein